MTEPTTTEEVEAAPSSADTSNAVVPAPGLEMPFNITLPPPVETALVAAIKAIQEWWANFEPQMRQLTDQVMTAIQPLLQSSMEGLKKLDEQLAPQKEQAAALLAEWKAKLDPHMAVAVEYMNKVTDDLRVKAYEPALEHLKPVIEAIKAHAEAVTKLVQEKTEIGMAVSKEWWEKQQPHVQAAQAMALEQSKVALAALEKFQKELEPQVKALQDKAAEEAKKLGEKTKEVYEKEVVPRVEAAKVEVTTVYWPKTVETATKLKELADEQIGICMPKVQDWFMMMAHKICLPIAPDLVKYKGMEKDYPPAQSA